MTIATMSVTELRREVGKLLQMLQKGPVILTRRGCPQAVVLGYDEYQKMKAKLEEFEKLPAGAPESMSVKSLIEEMQIKYAQYPSFTQALLAERAREREREARTLRS